MPEPHPAAAGGSAVQRRFLTFRMDERLYALPAEDISEVIRVPAVARVPQSPKSLLGIANLRGTVLPLASLRGLLGKDEAAAGASSRAIVLGGAAPVALAVDAVDALVTVPAAEVETRQAVLVAESGERLAGAFEAGAGRGFARILDVRSLLATAFVQRARPAKAASERTAAGREDADKADTGRMLVTFDVAGQEFGLALSDVQEIMPAPNVVAAVPHAEALVLGVTSFRKTLLPLLSLRGLLGFPPLARSDGREKVIVTFVRGVLVGLVADRLGVIVSAEPGDVDATPAVLAARSGGEAQIAAVYRGEGGRRLIPILAPAQLFREDVMQRLGDGRSSPQTLKVDPSRGVDELSFLIFRLGEEEFGLPIEAVEEVTAVPAQITRVPRTPDFLEGVVNMRGEVLPIVDQRRRFGMPPLADGARRRVVVVRTHRHRAGLIVDSVSEVLRSSSDAIEPAPNLTGEATLLVSGVINLEQARRIVMLLDPAELLSRNELGMLDAWQTQIPQADL